MIRHLQCDVSYAGGFIGIDQNMRDIYARSFYSIYQDLSERIAAYLTDHGYMGTQPGTLHRLIGTFSTRCCLKLDSCYSFPGVRNLFCHCNQIHHKTPHN